MKQFGGYVSLLLDESFIGLGIRVYLENPVTVQEQCYNHSSVAIIRASYRGGITLKSWMLLCVNFLRVYYRFITDVIVVRNLHIEAPEIPPSLPPSLPPYVIRISLSRLKSGYDHKEWGHSHPTPSPSLRPYSHVVAYTSTTYTTNDTIPTTTTTTSKKNPV